MGLIHNPDAFRLGMVNIISAKARYSEKPSGGGAAIFCNPVIVQSASGLLCFLGSLKRSKESCGIEDFCSNAVKVHVFNSNLWGRGTLGFPVGRPIRNNRKIIPETLW